MSVVAGGIFFGTVKLASDCRLSVIHGGKTIYIDNVQKIFSLTHGTAIGFVGDVGMASLLIRMLAVHLERRRRRDPVSLFNWIPRFMRRAYAAAARKKGHNPKDGPRVSFMVASSLPGVFNLIERKRVDDLLTEIGRHQSHVPSVLIKILATSPDADGFVPIPCDSAGLLYTIGSPRFEPKIARPLEFCAIGSGREAMRALERDQALLVGFSEDFFTDALSRFVRREGIKDVGGMYPMLELSGGLTQAIAQHTRIPAVGGEEIVLAFEHNQWVQRNISSGKEMKILPPWEISALPARDQLFDDVDRAMAKVAWQGL